MTLRPNQPCFRCAPIAQRLIEQRDDCLAERDALRQEVERLRGDMDELATVHDARIQYVLQLEARVAELLEIAKSPARSRIATLEAALQAIYAIPSFPARDIAERALGVKHEPAPRSTAELRASLGPQQGKGEP